MVDYQITTHSVMNSPQSKIFSAMYAVVGHGFLQEARVHITGDLVRRGSLFFYQGGQQVGVHY